MNPCGVSLLRMRPRDTRSPECPRPQEADESTLAQLRPIGTPTEAGILEPICAGRPRAVPMLLWTLSRPFEGFFGNKDSGQTNDGPLVLEGKLLSGHASS
jgi:hypothetical protein